MYGYAAAAHSAIGNCCMTCGACGFGCEREACNVEACARSAHRSPLQHWKCMHKRQHTIAHHSWQLTLPWLTCSIMWQRSLLHLSWGTRQTAMATWSVCSGTRAAPTPAAITQMRSMMICEHLHTFNLLLNFQISAPGNHM